ncbi:MAG: ComF family protein [Spirochaetes bacterium]|nr:ComF family protein [Spirochaetota bacterium]
MNRAGLVKNILESALGVLFPNRCFVCGAVLERGCGICDRCTRNIEFIYPPFCARCGAPVGGGASARWGAPIGTDTPGLIQDTDEDGLPARGGKGKSCIQCREYRFDFAKNESIGVYTGILRRLVGGLKFEKRKGLARTFATLFLEHKRGYIAQHAILVAVPLTPKRRAERGFNQASLIAERISKEFGIEFAPRCIKRRGGSKPQSSIGRIQERLSNLRDSFEVGGRHKSEVEGRSVLLIDDVLTTGATASACARALKKAGAARVDLLSCARTVKSSGTGSLLLAETGR